VKVSERGRPRRTPTPPGKANLEQVTGVGIPRTFQSILNEVSFGDEHRIFQPLQNSLFCREDNAGRGQHGADQLPSASVASLRWKTHTDRDVGVP